MARHGTERDDLKKFLDAFIQRMDAADEAFRNFYGRPTDNVNPFADLLKLGVGTGASGISAGQRALFPDNDPSNTLVKFLEGQTPQLDSTAFENRFNEAMARLGEASDQALRNQANAPLSAETTAVVRKSRNREQGRLLDTREPERNLRTPETNPSLSFLQRLQNLQTFRPQRRIPPSLPLPTPSRERPAGRRGNPRQQFPGPSGGFVPPPEILERQRKFIAEQNRRASRSRGQTEL